MKYVPVSGGVHLRYIELEAAVRSVPVMCVLGTGLATRSVEGQALKIRGHADVRTLVRGDRRQHCTHKKEMC